MRSKYIATFLLLLIVMCFMEESVGNYCAWRRRRYGCGSRRRRSCSPTDCQVSSWSPWSICSALQCGKSGYQQRTRHITRHPSCGGATCPSNLLETKTCYGITPLDCIYSTWSTWSACPSTRCGDSQTSRRYIAARQQCGGAACNMTALRRTRVCKQTFCVNQGTLLNGQCSCKPGYYGSCCQYNRNGKPCPYGQVGTSLATCKAGPQKLTSSYLGPPVVTFKQPKDEDSDVIDLLCIVSIDAKIRKWKNVTYQIDWHSEGKLVKQEQPFCAPPKGKKENDKSCPNQKDIRSILPGSGFYYEPGQWVTCEVKAKFIGTHPWSETVSVVKPFFAGIKVHPTTLIIEECKEPYIVQLKLTPTIPVRKNSDGLYVYVTFYLPDGLWLVNNKDKCIVEIKETEEVKVSIGATCTTLHGLKNLKVISPKIMNQKGFWSFYGLPTIWVSVLQKPKAIHKCKSVTDPHYRLLDAQDRERWADFMGDGDFVLYHNKEKDFEVQTRQWFCNHPGVTCNCGALIRDHNDVIRFSCCGTPRKKDQDSTTPIEVVIPGKKCLAPGISLKQLIKGINSKYEVIVPSGIRVILERNYWGIDVTIYAPRTASRNDEEGLCLYRNKALDGDMNTYGYRYRKKPSYFDQPPPHTNINTGGLNYERSCPCDKTKDKGKNKNKCVDGIPVYVPTATNDKLNRIKMCDRNPQKRDVEGSDDLTDEDFALFRNPSDNKLVRRMKRSITPVSRDNATRYCTEKLAETQVGKLCAKLGANVQALVNVCSSDIEFTGDFSFAIGAASMLMAECNDVIIQNITVNTNTTNSTSTEAVKIPPIVEEISELLCPNDCAFNGKCINGSCVCNKDYTAKDCSISVYQRPDISRLQTDGLCDRRKRRCKKVSVLGTGYLNSTSVTCHVEEMEVVNSSWTPNKNETKYPGIMTDLVLVECHLPDSPVMSTQYDEKIKGIPAAGLMISVSNNGIHKSKEKLKFISYDSVCMECNVSTGCVLKKSACFINRYCFAANEANPKDWCQQCLPEVETNTWTKRQVNYPPNVTTVTDHYVVHGERLELPIEATDPEGMPITVSLLEGSPKDAVVQNNILLWNVTTNKTTHFFFKVTDACQASATLNITITINVCQCNNSGQCVPQKPRGRGFYSCKCAPGFTGKTCDYEIDECESYPCLRGGCIDHVNNYSCLCDLGFEGRNCDIDINYCKSSPCSKGNCTDEVNGYTCNCIAGYTGDRCNAEIDECSSSPCLNNGTCTDLLNGYNCSCQVGYTGKNCDTNIDECQSSPCINGTCSDKVNGFSCVCEAGFTGMTCNLDINECLQASCANGTCVDKVNNYSCICNAGFTGRNCDVVIKTCSSDSCYPGVPCNENSNSIYCGSCPFGFTGDGKNCEDINDCVNHTCQNGGSCVDGINNFTCNCLKGYTGSHCQTDINDCVNHTCLNGGSCVDGENNYTCRCVAGFKGDRCETNINDCVNNTCQNGGSCVDGINNFTCNCLKGYTGSHCQTDINDCVNHTCLNGGSCVDGVNNYTCRCVAGFKGDHCETNVNECANHTCQNGGSCVDGINTFTCNCLKGYTGSLCETDINDCVNHKCLNGGSCVDGENNYTCSCAAGFTGDRCETNIDDCISVTCNNGGTCEDGIQSFTCVCPYGYTGKFCDTELPTKSSESTTEPAQITTDEVSEEQKTDFTFEVRVNEEWDDQLKDENSEKYKKISTVLKEQIQRAYFGKSELQNVEIISFRKGSIVAEFKLTFKTSLTAKQAMAPLKQETADGKLGSLEVDSNSLKLKDNNQGGNKEEESSKSSNLPLIIGVTCGAIVLIATIVISVVFHCRRSNPRDTNSDRMPAEGSGSKRERYELKPIDSKDKDIVSVEEKGINNEGME